MFFVFRLKRLAALLLTLAVIGTLTVFAIQSEPGVRLPVIMYHGLLKDPSCAGRYIISPAQLESDLQYLKEHGYTAVTVSDLIAYTKDGAPLPEKPVMLTFDDGFYNNYLYALPLMEQYDMKMVLSVVGAYTDLYTGGDHSHANYSYVTWPQIQEMIDSGRVEIQNHTYDMHSISNKRYGCKKNKGESTEHYQKLLAEDLKKLQDAVQAHTGYTPTAFTYPFGGASESSYSVIKDLGFAASLSCAEGINTITSDPECLYMLKRMLRPSGVSSERFFKDLP